MKMSTSEAGKARVITVEEERIDAAVAVHFKERMKELCGATPRQIVLDLSTVEFVDSSGLGAIVGAMKQLTRNRRLDLVGLNPAVEKVFRMTRMDSVFRIFDTIDDAVEDMADAS
ncbi:MAG: STAS domain-containing protein [Pseudomonadota bacterium]